MKNATLCILALTGPTPGIYLVTSPAKHLLEFRLRCTVFHIFQTQRVVLDTIFHRQYASDSKIVVSVYIEEYICVKLLHRREQHSFMLKRELKERKVFLKGLFTNFEYITFFSCRAEKDIFL